MTDEPEQDRHHDPERARERPEGRQRPEGGQRPAPPDEDPNLWTREGTDAPDAADIEEPEEQR